MNDDQFRLDTRGREQMTKFLRKKLTPAKLPYCRSSLRVSFSILVGLGVSACCTSANGDQGT
jgi:hypothetical protein